MSEDESWNHDDPCPQPGCQHPWHGFPCKYTLIVKGVQYERVPCGCLSSFDG